MSTVAKIRRQIGEILRYLWVAAVATAVNLSSVVLYREEFGMDFTGSTTAGYMTGIVVGFVLSRTFSFKDKTSTSAKSESVKYIFVTLCAYAVTLGAGLAIRSLLGWLFENSPEIHTSAVQISSMTGRTWFNRDLVANMGGIGVGFFVNFFGHKYVTFRKTDTINRIRRRVTV